MDGPALQVDCILAFKDIIAGVIYVMERPLDIVYQADLTYNQHHGCKPVQWFYTPTAGYAMGQTTCSWSKSRGKVVAVQVWPDVSAGLAHGSYYGRCW